MVSNTKFSIAFISNCAIFKNWRRFWKGCKLFWKIIIIHKVEEVEEWSEQEEISSSQIEIKIDEEKQGGPLISWY